MASYGQSRETRAPADRIWRIWSDTATWPEWNPDVQSMALDGPFTAGTTGTMKTKQGTRRVQLTDVAPGRSFRLETTVIPLTRFAFECQVAAGPAGNTTISQGIRVGGPLGGLVGGMMSRQIADTFPALLRGLARKAEASEGRS